MKKQDPTTKKWFIDADVIVEKYNHEHDDLRQLTKNSLAEKLDVTPQTLSDWKKRDVKLIQTLKHMAFIGNCSIEDFIKSHD